FVRKDDRLGFRAGVKVVQALLPCLFGLRNVTKSKDGVHPQDSRNCWPVILGRALNENLILTFWPILRSANQFDFFRQNPSSLGRYGVARLNQRRLSRFSGFTRLPDNAEQGENNRECCYSVGPSKEATPTWKVAAGVLLAFGGLLIARLWGQSDLGLLGGLLCILLGG